MFIFIISALKIIFLLGFLIFIHESGHFLVAKLCKVKVKEFALGFGPIIWSKQGKETKYALRAIPLGGFVNMLGEAERSEEEGSFSKSKIWKRILIVVAGGTVNIIFGIIVYFMLATYQGGYISTEISEVTEGYSAESVGIKANDKIIEINGKKIRLKTDLDKLLAESNGNDTEVKIKRNEEILTFNLKPREENIKSIGIYLGTEGEDLDTTIKLINPGSGAELAGLLVQDKIISINGQKLDGDAVKGANLISNSKNENIDVVVLRGNEELSFSVKSKTYTTYYLGVLLTEAENNFSNNIYYAFWDTVKFSMSIAENIKLMFMGNVSINEFMGPIGISQIVVETNGVYEFIYLLALISLSLGVTNLLPIIPLDGGKIVLLLIEGIIRKPINQKVEVTLQMVGFFLIIGLSLYVSYNDILRIF